MQAARIRTASTTGSLLLAVALILFARRAVNDPLWSDELLTTLLLQADSLPKLWAGIALGIDGNPPLYMTVNWLIAQALPAAVPAVTALKLVNMLVAVMAAAALWLWGRRLVSSAACWLGVLMFVTLNDNFIFAALELRTYAAFLLMAALGVWLQQRLIERRRSRDIALLAFALLGLTLSHTFGIAYVGCIALAGWLSAPRDRSLLRNTLLALAPSLLALAGWLPVLMLQIQIARPYGWMTSPGGRDLAETLFASDIMVQITVIELACLGATGIAVARRWSAPAADLLHDPQRQPARYAVLLGVLFTAFMLAAWLASKLLFPIFVPRYFTPQLVIAFALHAVFAEWLLRLGRERWAAAVALTLVVAALMVRNVAFRAEVPFHGDPICANADGAFFEQAYMAGDVPVITDSPHVFLPRATYGLQHSSYRLALDWDVVLKYPRRSPGNAVDYNLMNRLRTWLPMPQAMTTEDIIEAYPQFLVLEASSRPWFDHLRQTRNVEATKLAESIASDPGDLSCKLWRVTRVSR